MQKNRLKTVGLMAAAALVIALAPSAANAIPLEATRSHTTAVPVEAVPPLDPNVPVPAIDPAFQEVLTTHGIEKVISVQDANGGTAYLDTEGDFLLDIDDATLSSVTGGATTSSWNAGICVGNFHDILRVSGPSLQWGATNNCFSAGSLYLHDLNVTLRDTCVGPFCIVMDELWTGGSAAGGYDALQVVSEVDYCAGSGSGDDRRYDMIAYPVVRSVHYGPIVSATTDIDNCDVEPG